MKFRKTKVGIAFCPFIIWTSENIEGEGHTENDVNLTFCSHPKNSGDCEGNCQEKLCPLIPAKVIDDADLCGRLAKGDPDSI